jgi:hypothetical protein
MDGGGTGSSAIPIYNVFVELAKKLGPSFISMIMPAKWYSGGRGLDEFRKTMLNDRQIRALFDFEDSRDCFPTVDIAGGVCYFLWQRGFSGKCEITNVGKYERLKSSRYLNEFDTFIRNPQTLAILDKVKGKNDSSFLSDTVFSSKPFGIRSYVHGKTSATDNDNVKLFGSDGITYVSEDEVTQNKQLIGSWKVIMSKAAAEHAGQTDSNGRKKIIARLEVLPPSTICTESYLLLSAFENEEEANNMKKYMQTQFVRFLLSSILITQNIAKDKFAFVPLQDFTPSSDIDWSQSVADIDRQLYKKYGLTDEETAFIERTIKPME